MIACISPGTDSADHTNNTLQYSKRLKFKKEPTDKDSESRQSLSKKVSSKPKIEKSSSQQKLNKPAEKNKVILSKNPINKLALKPAITNPTSQKNLIS